MKQRNTKKRNTKKRNTKKRNTKQRNTKQRNTKQRNTKQRNTRKFKPTKNSIRFADSHSSWSITDKEINPSPEGVGLNLHRFKQMNCSPLVKGKTVNRNSCYTEDILITIKNEYNKDHRDNPIISKSKNRIWTALKERLSNCEKENCWLKEIDDTILRKKIEKLIFAPNQPPEWKKNPDEWLSNIDILDVLKQYEKAYPEFKFIGPTPIDFDTRLPDRDGQCVWKDLCKFSLEKFFNDGKRKIGIVFNLDKHNERGSHWVSLFIDIQSKYILYFDSVGHVIEPEIATLVDRIIQQGLDMGIHFDYTYNQNPKQHQQGNTECGMYSLYFITTLLTDTTGNGKVLKTVQEKKDYFNNDRISDEYVFEYRKKFYND